MNEKSKSLAELLDQHFGAKVQVIRGQGRRLIVEVGSADLPHVAVQLRDQPDFAFEQLIDLCGVDFLSYGQTEWDTEDATSEGFSRGVEGLGPGRFDWADRPEATALEQRFAVVVQLLSPRHNQRIQLRYFAPDQDLPIVPTLVTVWNSANWYEREAFDLFGIIFDGHPDLRRILTDYGFTGHPFRKDFPLIGNVTVRYDAAKARVVYEPVEIESRVLVPRVIREDSRYKTDDIDLAADDAAEQIAGENG
jgi:NADH-quinone oxidoreductase subunit C